jgi:hypothetical protein
MPDVSMCILAVVVVYVLVNMQIINLPFGYSPAYTPPRRVSAMVAENVPPSSAQDPFVGASDTRDDSESVASML